MPTGAGIQDPSIRRYTGDAFSIPRLRTWFLMLAHYRYDSADVNKNRQRSYSVPTDYYICLSELSASLRFSLSLSLSARTQSAPSLLLNLSWLEVPRTESNGHG